MPVFCHVHQHSIQILPNIRHLVSIDLKNSVAKSWQWNLHNYIDNTKHSGGQKILCPSMSKSWGGHVHPSPLLRSTYRHLACEHPKVCEDKKVIIEYMKQEFRFVDTLLKQLIKDIQQLSTRRSMQVSGISHSWVLNSGLVAVFHRHSIAVYLKCSFAVFVILFGQRSALVYAVQLPAISTLAKIKGKMHTKCLQFKLINTPMKINLMSSNQECMRSTKSSIESKILCKNISKIWVLTLADRDQLIKRDGVIWLRYFWLQNGRASRRNIISTMPGTKQFIPLHVDNVKDMFQGCGTTTRWPYCGIVNYWSSSTWR